MGIVNVTPDSFSDGGRSFDPQSAIEQGRRMLEAGAAILDIGGESTRPGADPVAAEEEQRRILPVIETLARDGARISVDTRNASTMARALDCGAMIVNDVSGLRHDKAAAPLLARRRCPVILMHMRGDPRTMNSLTEYGDVALDVLSELGEIVDRAVAAGIDRARIAVDPGFGFAKTASQSRELLERLPLFVNLLCPIIAGMSRKRFVCAMAGLTAAEERDTASVAAGVIALSLGATVLRVHNVRATVQAAKVWHSVQAQPGPKRETED
jgi:dihydropteroate synthase